MTVVGTSTSTCRKDMMSEVGTSMYTKIAMILACWNICRCRRDITIVSSRRCIYGKDKMKLPSASTH